MSLIAELQMRARAGRLNTSMERGPRQFHPPANPQDVALAEAQLGFALPPLLRDLYTKVANGGFGPGCGLFGIAGGATFEEERNIVELYQSFRRQRTRTEPWAEKLLPICHWGCSYFSYLDCALPQAPVMALDENSHGHGPWGCAFSLHAASFDEWMQRWVNGEDLWLSIALEGEPKFGFEEYAQDGSRG